VHPHEVARVGADPDLPAVEDIMLVMEAGIKIIEEVAAFPTLVFVGLAIVVNTGGRAIDSVFGEQGGVLRARAQRLALAGGGEEQGDGQQGNIREAHSGLDHIRNLRGKNLNVGFEGLRPLGKSIVGFETPSSPSGQALSPHLKIYCGLRPLEARGGGKTLHAQTTRQHRTIPSNGFTHGR